MTTPERRAALKRGERGEWLAALALRLKGFAIVARRYRCKAGEIDLVGRRGDLVIIVEVKARATLEQALEAVTPAAWHRIEAAADHWTARQRDHGRLSIRFDVIAILPGRWPVHVPAVHQSRFR